MVNSKSHSFLSIFYWYNGTRGHSSHIIYVALWFILFVFYQLHQLLHFWRLFVFKGIGYRGISKPMPLFICFPVISIKIYPPCFKNKWNMHKSVNGTWPAISCLPASSSCTHLTATAWVLCGLSSLCSKTIQHSVAIDFPGGKRRRNIKKMRSQLMIFMWRGMMTEIEHKVFKTTLLTFRCGHATCSQMWLKPTYLFTCNDKLHES